MSTNKIDDYMSMNKHLIDRRNIIGMASSILPITIVGSPIKSIIGSFGTYRQDDGIEKFENPYVQDGLVSMWDGTYNDIRENGDFFHNSNCSTWKDLVGGHHFTLVNGNAHFEKNAFSSDLGGAVSYKYAAIGDFVVKNIPTIEMVLRIRSFPYATESLILNSNIADSRIFFGWKTACWCKNRGGYTNAQHFVPNSLFSLCCIMDDTTGFYVNGVHFSFSINATLSVTGMQGKTLIGNRVGGGTGRNFDGLIYNMRMYNRVLSQEEVTQNYLIDKERFAI